MNYISKSVIFKKPLGECNFYENDFYESLDKGFNSACKLRVSVKTCSTADFSVSKESSGQAEGWGGGGMERESVCMYMCVQYKGKEKHHAVVDLSIEKPQPIHR